MDMFMILIAEPYLFALKDMLLFSEAVRKYCAFIDPSEAYYSTGILYFD